VGTCPPWDLLVATSHASSRRRRSVTSDLGVEIGLADWRTSDLTAMLPAWIDCSSLKMDVGPPDHGRECDIAEITGGLLPDVEDEDLKLRQDVDVASSTSDLDTGRKVDLCSAMPAVTTSHLMPRTMTVAGACHLMHHVCEDSFEGMSYWSTFWAHLKTLDELLMKASGLERLLARCCTEGSPDKNIIQGMKNVRLYKERWGVVVSFLKAVKPIMFPLRRVWSWSKFQGDIDDEVELEVQNDQVDSLLRDARFAIYMDMILLLHTIPEKLLSWMEGCSCHDFASASAKTKAKHLSAEFEGKATSCPMSGLRAAELAAGKHLEHMQALMRQGRQRILSLVHSHSSGTTTAQLEVVLLDYELCCSKVEAAIRTKLNFWDHLPWKLCGMGHWDESLARSIASQCVAMYDAVPATGSAVLHHRISWIFLDHGSHLRRFVCDFAMGEPMQADLRFEVMALRLIPVVERTIERAHLPIGRAVRHKRTRSGSAVSCACRFPDLTARIVSDPAFTQRLLVAFESTRAAKFLVSTFGLQKHRDVRAIALRTSGMNHSALWSVLERLIYRQDLITKFEDFSLQYAAHKEEIAAGSKRAAEVLKTSMAKRGRFARPDENDLQAIMQSSAREHLKKTAAEGDVFIRVPAASFPLHALSHCLWRPSASDIPISATLGEALFLKVAHDSLGQKKFAALPAAAQVKLSSEDLAFTCHERVKESMCEKPAVFLSPQRCGAASLLLLRSEDVLKFHLLSEEATVWKCTGRLQYCFDSSVGEGNAALDTPAASTAAGRLVEEGAFEGASGFVAVPRSEIVGSIWGTLIDIGYVTVESDTTNARMRLSRQGLATVRYGSELLLQRRLFIPLHGVSVSQLTMFECIYKLEEVCAFRSDSRMLETLQGTNSRTSISPLAPQEETSKLHQSFCPHSRRPNGSSRIISMVWATLLTRPNKASGKHPSQRLPKACGRFFQLQ